MRSKLRTLPNQERNLDRMVADVRESLQARDSIAISALNYGLTTGQQIIDGLTLRLRPDNISVGQAGGFLGYIHFTKERS